VQVVDAQTEVSRRIRVRPTARVAKRLWRDGLKSAVERPLALILLAILSPLLLVIAIAVWSTTGSPIVYRRRVVGYGGTEFDALKFRTMVNGAERVLEGDEELRKAFTVNWKLFADPRVTRTGRILRKYSLDELLQLVNVVKGEMSLIGPRMISPPELDRYDALGSKLVSVKPGLTGLWQVSGRQSVSYERRVELDMHYIDNCSLTMDLSILLRTVPVVFKAEGAF